MDIIALDVRLDGFSDPIGNLVRDEDGALAFAYADAYLEDPNAFPLSLSFPLAEKIFDDNRARPFFDNLLQERDGILQRVMDREGLARSDVAGLLFHLGKDCAGALSVLPLGSPPVKVPGDYDLDYKRIENDRLNAIIRSLHKRQRLPEGTEDPSPLAGVQSKIAVTILPDGTYAEPIAGSGAPTTHIVKVPNQGHPHDARLELETLNLSRELGFETAQASVVNFGGIDALVVERFDRRLNAQNKIVRIHQEDFAQALGLPPSLKYERHGKEGRRFDAQAINRILESTGDPVGEKRRFIGAVLFDLMTGNVDAHAKNFALLYDQAGGVRVSPRYDLLPTRLDPTLTDLFAFSIGNATKLDELQLSDFLMFLEAFGIVSSGAKNRLTKSLAISISTGLAHELQRLDRISLKRFADLIAHNIDELLSAFDFPLPAGVRARDAYIERGGGWLLGS